MIDFNISEIVPLCAEFGVELTADKQDKLNLYGNLLLEWNEKMNLTAIKEPKEVLYKHFYDCILFFKNVEIPQNATLIDIGTGAGFPGLVLKIVRPDIEVTLLDSLNKRLVFLNEVIGALELEGIKTLHSRAEDGGKNKLYREKFQIATARAVASMPVLLEYCLPFVENGGQFVAMKGPTAKEEASLCTNALKVLGGEKPQIFEETLTGDEKRVFLICKKISQTPSKYPRKPSDISKQPL